MQEIGYTIKALRESRGLTQDALAHAAGCSRASVQLWEQGRGVPNKKSRQLLAQAFGVSVEALVEAGKGPAKKGRTKESLPMVASSALERIHPDPVSVIAQRTGLAYDTVLHRLARMVEEAK